MTRAGVEGRAGARTPMPVAYSNTTPASGLVGKQDRTGRSWRVGIEFDVKGLRRSRSLKATAVAFATV